MMNAPKAVDTSTSEEVIVPLVPPGVIFKAEHGYTRTMAKLMKKYGVSTVEEYRSIRKQNQKTRRTRKAKPVAVKK